METDIKLFVKAKVVDCDDANVEENCEVIDYIDCSDDGYSLLYDLMRWHVDWDWLTNYCKTTKHWDK